MTSPYNYIGGYYDYKNDTIINLKNLYYDLKTIKYEINTTIRSMVYSNFNVELGSECLYIIEPMRTTPISYKQEIKCPNNDIIIISKNSEKNTIDIYKKQINKGYIYNSKNTQHVYKFFLSNVYKETNHFDTIDGVFEYATDGVFEDIEKNEKNEFTKKPLGIKIYSDNFSLISNEVKHDMIVELSERIKTLKID